jgi:hypothetical protein
LEKSYFTFPGAVPISPLGRGPTIQPVFYSSPEKKSPSALRGVVSIVFLSLHNLHNLPLFIKGDRGGFSHNGENKGLS